MYLFPGWDKYTSDFMSNTSIGFNMCQCELWWMRAYYRTNQLTPIFAHLYHPPLYSDIEKLQNKDVECLLPEPGYVCYQDATFPCH